MSEGWAPGLFFIGLLALAADSCDSRRSASRTSEIAFAQPQPQREPPPPVQEEWDERSDCQPGAPPNSLANAIDVLGAHCDRARAVAVVASVAGLALPIRGIGRAAVRGMATRGAMAEATSAGVAAEETALSGQAAARIASQAYRLGETSAGAIEDRYPDGEPYAADVGPRPYPDDSDEEAEVEGEEDSHRDQFADPPKVSATRPG